MSLTRSRRPAAVGLLVLGLAWGCGDGSGPKIGPPASVSRQSVESQTGTVGTAVTTPPSVVVRDADGDAVPGVSVTFAVTAGGGSVTGGTTTTNESGIATVGSWTLGTTAGQNTLTATAAGVTQSVTFTATGTAGPAAAVSAHAGNNQTAPVGSAVPTRPAVRVVDQFGNPKSGVTVTFAVASGGGGATPTTATTDADGIATVGSWTLGTSAGANTLTATVAGLTPATFTATGVPLAPASLTKQAGDNQTALAGTNVPVAPSVLVRDQHNNPVPNATVTFAVASGGGSVTGGTATTNASGVATVGSWRLGNTPGTNTLTASVSGVAAVTFTATGLDPCTQSMALGVPASVNGELTTIDCQIAPSHYADRYSMTLTAASALTLNMNSTAFDAVQILVDAQENLVAFNDDRPADLNSSIRILAAPGSYTLYATSIAAGSTGAYSVSTATATGNVTGCSDDIQNMVWITAGVSTNQQLQNTDCDIGTGGFATYADVLAISLAAGRTYRITQTATTYQPVLTLYDLNGHPVLGEYEDSPGLSRVTFTPAEDDFYFIEATADGTNVTGPYTLSVEASGTIASASAARVARGSPAPGVLTGRKAPRTSLPATRTRRVPE